MKAGTLLFNGIDLALYGTPRFTMRTTPEPGPPAPATHRRIAITVTLDLCAEMTATAWARARKLNAILAQKAEGLLEIHSENGSTVSWMAVPGETSLPEAIVAGRGRVDMSFSAIEPVSAADFPVSLSVDTLNGEAPVAISRVMNWSETVRPNRPNSRSAVRDEITSTITFTARTAFADPSASLAVRCEALQAEATRIRAISGKEASLSFAGFERTLQFESVTATPNEGWEWLEVQAQARYVTLPGDTEAEVQFDVDSDVDSTTGETRTSVTGTIKAPSRTIAYDKVNALVAAWRTTTRRVLSVKKTDTYLDGEDTNAAEWTGLRFEIRLSEGSDQVRYTLKIDTREAQDGRRITYSGNATAKDVSTLLATVASAAGSKHPVEIRSELSIEFTTDDQGTERLAQGNFSYEYQVASLYLRGTINRSNSKGVLSEWTTSISGTMTSNTEGNARTAARSFIPSVSILRTDDERSTSGLFSVAPNGSGYSEQFASIEFTYTWGTTHTTTGISYTDTTSPDYSRMIQERTISGTCYALNRATAETAVTAFLATLAAGNPTKASLTHSGELSENATAPKNKIERWLSFQFSYTFEGSITGAIGHDVIEAQWSLERTGQVDHKPITEVPLTSPVMQSGFGFNIGTLVASGTVRARQQGTALLWGQGKRAKASAVGATSGAEDPPRERMSVTMVPFSQTEVAAYQFDFTYSYRFSTGLTGLWPGTLLL